MWERWNYEQKYGGNKRENGAEGRNIGEEDKMDLRCIQTRQNDKIVIYDNHI